MPNIRKKRGALFFTVDTLVAGVVFTMTVIVVLSIYLSEPETQDTYLVIDNYVTYLSEVKMDKFRNVYRYVYDDPSEPDPNLYVYQKVSKLYYEGDVDTAQSFVSNFTDVLVPPQFGISYKIDDVLIYQKLTGLEDTTRTNLSTKLLTFFMDNETIVGPNITTVSIWS